MKNKKITIYELSGLIKDNKAPKKIKYAGQIWEFNGNKYESDDTVFCFTHYIDMLDFFDFKKAVEILPEKNDEWEDIEEIKELQFGGDCKYRFTSENGTEYEIPKEIKNIINQLIKNQKYLKEKLESK